MSQYLETKPNLNVKTSTPTCGVNGHAGDPLAVGRKLLHELLLDEVVDANVPLRGHEEVGADGVEGHALHQAFVLAEGVLRSSLGYLVDEHLRVAVVWHDTGQVVALAVPGQLPDRLYKQKQRQV